MKIVQFVRMTTAQAGAYLGPVGQVIVDLGSHALRVMDGVVPGGFSTLMAQNNLNDLPDKAAARAGLGLGTAATHAFGDFDPAGAATAALVTAEAYTDAKSVTDRSYTDAGVTTAEAFATAADVTNLAAAKTYADVGDALAMKKAQNGNDVASKPSTRTNLASDGTGANPVLGVVTISNGAPTGNGVAGQVHWTV